MLSESTTSSFIDRLRAEKPNGEDELAYLAYQANCGLFCDMYGPLIRSWAVTRLHLQDSDADDFVQEVLVVALDKIHQFQVRDSFRGWLWTILKNQVRMWRRKHQHDPVVRGGSTFHEIIESLPDHAPRAETDRVELDEGELVERLRQHGCNQTEPTLRAFIHYCIFGRDPGDVAEDLGMSISSVYQAKKRVGDSLSAR
ncbi:MAG: sigma-70 family RNA polymerase sigma factor [Pirellulaceae bacterium]